MNKLDVFKDELKYIKKDNYKDDCKKLINLLPDYFFSIPASSTGKYHPNYASNEGGLVRHTKVVVRIAYELLNNKIIGSDFTDDEKDLIIIALLLHDGLKSGLNHNRYTLFEHPLIMAKFIRDNNEILSFSDEEIALLTSMIESHSGEWTRNNYSDIILPTPESKYQKFAHMCDFLASRKFLNVNFQNNDFID
jgi:hypothetical protein